MILCRVGAFRTSWLVDVRGSLVPERPWVATPYMCLCAAHGDNLSMNGNIRRLLSLGLGTPSRAALEGFVYGRVDVCVLVTPVAVGVGEYCFSPLVSLSLFCWENIQIKLNCMLVG